MSTAATIRFQAGDQTLYLCRGHDGTPGVVLPELQAAIDQWRGRVSDPELGLLVSFFLAHQERRPRPLPGQRWLPDYEVVTGYRGDESNCFRVWWDGSSWLVVQELMPDEAAEKERRRDDRYRAARKKARESIAGLVRAADDVECSLLVLFRQEEDPT